MSATEDPEPVDEEEGEAEDTGCTRCDAPLVFLGKRSFHDGGSFILPRIFEGRTVIEMWACEDCGHVEFFMPLR